MNLADLDVEPKDPPVTPDATDEPDEPTGLPVPTRRLKLTRASDIKMRPVRWLWDARIPAGMTTLIAGRPGIGKSLTLVWLCAQVTRGLLPGVHQGKPQAVVYAATEDSWEHTIAPRLVAAGADLDKVFRIDAVEQDMERPLNISLDYKELAAAIVEHRVAMLALDPLMSALGGGVDAHRNNEVRAALLEPLARLADTTGCTAVGLAHFRKSTAGTDPLAAINGSSAFGEVIRAALGVARDPDAEDGSCVVSPAKGNLGPDAPSLRYLIDSVVVDTAEGPAPVGRLRWLGETDTDVRDILSDRGDPDERAEREDARGWLVDYLTGCGGEAAAKDVLKAAKADGFAERTLQRARSKAGVVSERRGFGQGAMWRLDASFTPHSRHSRQEDSVAPMARMVAATEPEPVDEPAPAPVDSDAQTCGECGATPPATDWGWCARCRARVHRYNGGHGTLCRDCRAERKGAA